jgi:hypothetical protein
LECHYSVYYIFAAYGRHLQNVNIYFIWKLPSLHNELSKIRWDKHWLRSKPKEISFNTLLSIKTHSTQYCICSRPNYKMQLQECHQSQPVLFCTKCDSVSTFTDRKHIMFTCPILPSHKCKPGILDGKKVIRCVSHQNTLAGQLPFHLWGGWTSLDIIVNTTTHIIPPICMSHRTKT